VERHQAVRAGAADQGADPARALTGPRREHRGDRGGAAQLDREVQLVPQPAGGLAHVVVADQDDLVDQALDDVEGDLRARAGGGGAGGGGDVGELDQVAGAEALVQGGGADRLDADDAHRGADRLRGDGHAADQSAATDGDDQLVDVG